MDETKKNDNKKKRIEMIDALRGLAAILMVTHHLLYNLVYFFGAPVWLFTNPAFDVLHYIFAGLFIALSGVSSRFSRSNIKRGLIAIALAMGISAVTYYMEMPIWFGVLHLLGFSMLFFGLSQKLWDLIPGKAAPVIYIALLVVSAAATGQVKPAVDGAVTRNIVSILGWPQPGFTSYDYFPILPWLFVFLLGTWAGQYIREGKFPGWFYRMKPPVLPAVGRKALLIYILHQPVLYGVMMGIEYLISKI